MSSDLYGPSIPYADFRSSNQAFVADGGPWDVTLSPPTNGTQCSTKKAAWCGVTGYCLACETAALGSTEPSVKVTYSTRLFFSMAQYATELNYTWSFSPLLIGSKISMGSHYSMNTVLNTLTLEDSNLIAGNFSMYNIVPGSGPEWTTDSVVTHNGTVNLDTIQASEDVPHGYLAIKISYFINVTVSNDRVLHFMRDLDFKITTPTLTNITISPLSNPSSNYSVGPAVGTANPSASASPVQLQMSTTAMVGTAVGTIAFVVVIVVLFFLRLRRRRISRREGTYPEKKDKNLTPYPDEKNESAASTLAAVAQIHVPSTKRSPLPPPPSPIPLRGKAPLNPPPEREVSPIASNSPLRAIHPISPELQVEQPLVPNPIPTPATPPHTTQEQGHAASSVHSTNHEDASSVASEEPPPPNYDAPNERYEPYDMPPVSQALALFAQNNRELINEDLEARLAAAGYLPTDNPDALSQEEWRNQHNVTKLELVRLRILYERAR